MSYNCITEKQLPLKEDRKEMIIMKKSFKLLTIILAMSSFSSCTSLMALAGSEKADWELRGHTIEESKRYCAVSRVSTGECLEWRKHN